MYFPSFSKPKKNGLMQLDTCWGHLRVINIEREEVQAFSTVRRVDESDEEFAGRAISYATGEREPPVYVLECECGATVRVLASKFPGKRRMRSCGLPECEFSKPPTPKPHHAKLGRPPSSDPTVNVTLSVPFSLLKRVQESALAASPKAISCSRRASDLMGRGELWEMEQAEKAAG